MTTAVLSITQLDTPGHYVLVGRFDAHEVESLRQLVDASLESGATTIELDLAEVNFVDSTGLSELVRTMKSCREAGGDLIIAGVSNAVRVILELTRLDAALTMR